MSWIRTLGLVALAGGAVALTYATRSRPITVSAEAEQGTLLTPLLTDPLAVKSLEVIGFDEQSARPRGFKVEFDSASKRWVIPSAFNYPVEATQTMATAAAGFVNLLKERVVTDRPDEHQRLGVLDPSDQSTSATTGRGSRVTLRDAGGNVLADLILGAGVREDAPGATTRKYVRESGRNRVYVTSAQVAFSTRLVDWLNTDLINLPSDEVRSIEVVRYRIDESTGKVKDFSRLELTRSSNPASTAPTDGQPQAPVWTAEFEPATPPADTAQATKPVDTPPLNPSPVNPQAVEAALAALRDTKVMGVRPKPANLAKLLAGSATEGRMTIADQANLQSRGFFLTPSGSMMANEGQVNITSTQGVVYTLWLGELALDEIAKEQASGATAPNDSTPSTVLAGQPAANSPDAPGKDAPGRYVMLTASVDEGVLGPAPAKPDEFIRLERLSDDAAKEGGTPMTDQDKAALAAQRAAFLPLAEAHTQRMTAARTKAAQLSQRFADWYYVASAQDLEKLRPTRAAVLAQPATPPVPQPPQPPASLPETAPVSP